MTIELLERFCDELKKAAKKNFLVPQEQLGACYRKEYSNIFCALVDDALLNLKLDNKETK